MEGMVGTDPLSPEWANRQAELRWRQYRPEV